MSNHMSIRTKDSNSGEQSRPNTGLRRKSAWLAVALALWAAGLILCGACATGEQGIIGDILFGLTDKDGFIDGPAVFKKSEQTGNCCRQCRVTSCSDCCPGTTCSGPLPPPNEGLYWCSR